MNKQELLVLTQIVKNENVDNANTATRIGTILEEIVNSSINKEELKQTAGEDPKEVMSQGAVSDALGNRYTKQEVDTKLTKKLSIEPQTLTPEEKEQVKTNIGVTDFMIDMPDNAVPIVIYNELLDSGVRIQSYPGGAVYIRSASSYLDGGGGLFLSDSLSSLSDRWGYSSLSLSIDRVQLNAGGNEFLNVRSDDVYNSQVVLSNPYSGTEILKNTYGVVSLHNYEGAEIIHADSGNIILSNGTNKVIESSSSGVTKMYDGAGISIINSPYNNRLAIGTNNQYNHWLIFDENSPGGYAVSLNSRTNLHIASSDLMNIKTGEGSTGGRVNIDTGEFYLSAPNEISANSDYIELVSSGNMILDSLYGTLGFFPTTGASLTGSDQQSGFKILHNGNIVMSRGDLNVFTADEELVLIRPSFAQTPNAGIEIHPDYTQMHGGNGTLMLDVDASFFAHGNSNIIVGNEGINLNTGTEISLYSDSIIELIAEDIIIGSYAQLINLGNYASTVDIGAGAADTRIGYNSNIAIGGGTGIISIEGPISSEVDGVYTYNSGGNLSKTTKAQLKTWLGIDVLEQQIGVIQTLLANI